MATFQIRIVNHRFSASADHECPERESAVREAIKSALEIGVELISGGAPFFAAEVRVEQHGRLLERHMVTTGTSPLQ